MSRLTPDDARKLIDLANDWEDALLAEDEHDTNQWDVLVNAAELRFTNAVIDLVKLDDHEPAAVEPDQDDV